MPFVEDNQFARPNAPLAAPPEPMPEASFDDMVGAVFRLENSVVNAVDLMTAPQFEPEADFDIANVLDTDEKKQQFYTNPSRFYGVNSQQAYEARRAKVAQEDADLRIYAESGTAGTITALMAGILSPTNFIPVVGVGARGWAALRSGMMLGASAGAIDTMMLSANQTDRGIGEAAIDIGAGAVLGGLLGSLVGNMTPQQLARARADMAPGGPREYGPGPLTPNHNEPTVPHEPIPTDTPPPPELLPPPREKILARNVATLLKRTAPEGTTLDREAIGFMTGKVKRPIPEKIRASADEADWVTAMPHMRTQREMVDWLAGKHNDPKVRALAARIADSVSDDPVLIVRPGDVVPRSIAQALNTSAGALFSQWRQKGVSALALHDGTGGATAIHELLHAATARRLRMAEYGEGDAAANTMLERIRGLQAYIVNGYTAQVYGHMSPSQADAFLTNPHELITYALTDKLLPDLLKQIKMPNQQTAWSFFVHTLRKLFNIPEKDWTALDEVLDILDKGVMQPKVAGPAGGPADAGAASVRSPGAGRLKGIAGTKFQGDFVSYYGGKITESPVVQVINNPVSGAARWLMSQLSDAGLVLEGNTFGRVTAEGGTVENRAKAWYTGLARAVQTIDGSYAEYLGTNAKLFRNTRAVVKGAITPGKLSKHEFNLEISRAMREGDEFDGPTQAAQAAARIRELIYDPMTKEAISVGLLKPDDIEKVVGDITYLNRMYDNNAIRNNKAGFIRKLAANFEQKLSNKLAVGIRRLKEREAADTDLIEDLGLSGPELEQARKAFSLELEYLYGTPTGEKLDQILSIKQMASTLQAKLTEAGNAPIYTMVEGVETLITPEYVQKLRQQIDALRAGFTEQDLNIEAQIKRVEKRVRNLNKSVGASADAEAAKLQKVDKIQENQIKTLRAMTRKVARLEKKIAKLDEKGLARELTRLRDEYDRVIRLLQSNEARARELGDRSPELEATVEKRYERMQRFRARMDNVEDLIDNRGDIIAGLREMQEAAYGAANDLNSRRTLRAERLKAQADALNPNRVRERIDALKERMKQRRLNFLDDWRERGADDIDMEAETGVFKEHAEEAARAVTDRILGTYNRLPGIDIIQDVRGPELARVLDIPSREIEEFLNNDVEFLMRSYMRTMGADIEMFRKFGSVDARDYMRQVELEFERAQDAAKTEKEKVKIRKLRDRTTDNLKAVIGRLRHEWGIPANPEGAAARLARVAQNINTLRFMGFVTVSSIPDMARLVMKFGLKRTMSNAILPLISDMKNFKLGAKEAQLAGTALDVIIHTRAHQMMDILEDYGKLSKAERALEFATSRIGLIAAFDLWTTGMKQLAAVAANAELLESIADAMGSAKPKARTVELLASAGIDGQRAATIWKLVNTAEGGGKRGNVYLPNTESWLDPVTLAKAGVSESQAREALASYRAALVGKVDSTIITPGVERPLWMDSRSLTMRLIGQFRSFSFASATKTVMAGMQQADMAVFNGMMFSLALGGLSYYLWAVASGGDSFEEMQNAGLDKWLDEMIQRSGLQASFAEVQKIAEAVPMTSNYASFSGQRSTRRGGGDLTDALGGPTLDLVERMSRVVSQLDDPTQSTLHTGRTLVPYQNVFWLKSLFDLVEEQVGADLPERRR